MKVRGKFRKIAFAGAAGLLLATAAVLALMGAASASSNPGQYPNGLVRIGGPICRVLHGNEKPDHKMCTPRAQPVRQAANR